MQQIYNVRPDCLSVCLFVAVYLGVPLRCCLCAQSHRGAHVHPDSEVRQIMSPQTLVSSSKSTRHHAGSTGHLHVSAASPGMC